MESTCFWAFSVLLVVCYWIDSGAGCESWEFTCRNHDCVQNFARCNGHQECQDGSDELNCPWSEGSTSTGNQGMAGGCTTDQFRCRNNRCVWKAWRCDNQNDCGDGSDEAGCTNTEDRDQPPAISASAIIGISVAVICVLCVLALIVGIWCYHKRKQRQRPSYPTPASVTDLPPGLAYSLPREALLREPPPRYTSTDNLAIVNPSYRDDDSVLPPPYYSSTCPPGGSSAHYSGLGPPPSYCSRQDLHHLHHQVVEDDHGPAAYSRYGNQGSTLELAVISSGVLRPGDSVHMSSLSHSTSDPVVVADNPAVINDPHPVSTNISSSSSRNHSILKPQPGVKDSVSSSVLKDSTCSLDDSKSSMVEDKSLSYSLHVEGEAEGRGKLSESSPQRVLAKPSTEGLNQAKSKAKSTPCLGTISSGSNDNPEAAHSTQDEAKPEDAGLTEAGSAPSVPGRGGRGLPRAPDLARWGAQILACSSRQQLDGSTYSISLYQDSGPDADNAGTLHVDRSAEAAHRRHSVSSQSSNHEAELVFSDRNYNSVNTNSPQDQVISDNTHQGDRNLRRCVKEEDAKGKRATINRNRNDDANTCATGRSSDARGLQPGMTTVTPVPSLQKAHSLPQLSHTAAVGNLQLWNEGSLHSMDC